MSIQTINRFEITPSNDSSNGMHKTGELRNITAGEIVEILGFGPNHDDDPSKVVHSWLFKIRDVTDPESKPVLCGIWDYKGSHRFKQFSTYGPHDLLNDLFFGHYHGRVY